MLNHLSDILECPWLKVHHMYISLHSPLHRRHLPDPTSMQSKFPLTLSVVCGRLAQWPSLLMIFSVPDEAQVCCIAFSANEKYIAVGLNDGNAYVWNALTGMRVSGPHSADVEGSRDSRESELGNVVTSVTFSREGQYLAFGLSNGTDYLHPGCGD